ncbi:hypothetical protein AWC29_28015 [Mycobacterium triplex]|uniref:Transmembrane protein n=1 Tax=Mycobacterium triplex TaxID=47839 RepID=A0A024JWI2_9MYCO|nr:hypothetical protein [Mycobacterium triplex]ORW99583.1 hypothetical protein AWC29_28015 [Mycobacterium triplex]CDO87593.1 hypothetical protein BN973_01948 [Mycobacterium triplex]
MTRIRVTSLFAAVVSGDYAALMLINGQPVEFGIAAAVCAGSVVAAGAMAYAGRRSRRALARGRAAVWERRDLQSARLCEACGPSLN